MATKVKYYWDACAWIALIQKEQSRIDSLMYVVDRARDKNSGVEIWTSAFSYAEVYKRPCGDELVGLEADKDAVFEDYLMQDFVQIVELTSDVGILARRLLRKHPTIRKPQDGVHLATALLFNCDELHTFDNKDLIALSGVIQRKDGVYLTIGNPPPPPPPPPAPPLPPLLEAIERGKREA